MIKTFLACATTLIALSGCMMMPGASNKEPSEVPAARIHIIELTYPTAGENEVKIICEPGVLLGANEMEFSINYVALANMRHGESFTAWLPDGTYTFSVRPEPNPQHVAPRTIDLNLSDGVKHTIRVGGNEFGTTLEEFGGK